MRWPPTCARLLCSDECPVNEELPPPGPLPAGGLRVTALGGISEIGRNMTVFEHLDRLLSSD